LLAIVSDPRLIFNFSHGPIFRTNPRSVSILRNPFRLMQAGNRPSRENKQEIGRRRKTGQSPGKSWIFALGPPSGCETADRGVYRKGRWLIMVASSGTFGRGTIPIGESRGPESILGFLLRSQPNANGSKNPRGSHRPGRTIINLGAIFTFKLGAIFTRYRWRQTGQLFRIPRG
jgi:hypothetical protein